jgi:alpha-D-ribose 1-methylphosphonate 5-triphosphate diphosphatase
MKTYLAGVRAVLPNATIEDVGIVIEDGIIAAIAPETAPPGCELVALHGLTLLPGLIDLHGDALEKEVEPRPNVFFPHDFAVAQADKRNAQAGITTAFHAISFAHDELGLRNNQLAAELVETVNGYRGHGLVDNRTHCRYEISDASGLPVLLDLLARGEVHLVSVMDHTPGQGQFKDVAAYNKYVSRTYGHSADEALAMIERKQQQAESAVHRVEALVAAAHASGVQIASHDDDNPERVRMMAALGISLSEFPVTLAAAETARQSGLVTIFGAPNILRGKSQSGSVRALDAVLAGVANCLCSDYAPATLLAAAFRLPALAGISLPDAVAMVTGNAADAAGLHDRGRLAVGLRADLIAVAEVKGHPQATAVWVAGERVYHAGYRPPSR